MEKINVAELLKDCPTGMELDCAMYDNCTYEGIEDNGYIDILINTPSGRIRLTKEGCYIRHDDNAKCIIFPKGKTTWEGFIPPCQFKNGDVIYVKTELFKWVSIFKKDTENIIITYADYDLDRGIYSYGINDNAGFLCHNNEICEKRIATEEEKQKLFQAIKNNGYKWNAETKTLEKLVQPIFEVGNKIEKCGYRFTIAEVKDDYYLTKCGNKIPFGNQDGFSLVPNKFDITTLKPFDKVVTKDSIRGVWGANIYSHYDSNSDKPFVCIGWSELNEYTYCIPYEGNEHLLGTTDDCDEYYKTWE